MPTPHNRVPAVIRERSTRLGMATILSGVVLLLLLRFWASPLVRVISGRAENGLAEFLMIPFVLVIVTVGIALMLWEPGRKRR